MTTVEAPPPVEDEGTRVTGHSLSAVDSTGDTKLIWDEANDTEVDAARKLFAELKGKGYLAYTVDKAGHQAEVIHEFDPAAVAIIMTPQLVGG